MTTEMAELPTPAQLMAEISESFASGAVENPYPIFAEYREKNSVHHGDVLAEFGATSMAAGFNGERDVYSIFRFEDCLRALKDSETFSSEAVGAVFRPLLGNVITGTDGVEHARLRKLFMPGLGRQNFEQWGRDIIDPVLRRLVTQVKEKDGRANLTEFVVEFPVRIVYEILGFPTGDDSLFHDFQCKALTILLGFGTTNPEKREQAGANRERAIAAVRSLYDDLMPIVQRLRAEGAPGNSLITYLLRTEVDGESLTDEEVVVFTRSLLPAAAETTTRSFGNTLVVLLNHPEVLERVRQDRSLVDKAISEIIRYEPVSLIGARTTTRDVEVSGVTIPEGAGVTVVKGAGMRDPRAWPDPDTFDIDRQMNRPNLGFGFGPHTCLGMMLARHQMGKALNLLLDELPNLRADEDAEPLAIRGANLRQPSAINVRWN